MIDLHSHILPGMDDGARSLDEAVAMMRMASAAGTTDIAATSHFNLTYDFDPRAVEEKVSELQRAIGNVIRVHYGCELHLTLEGVEDAVRFPRKYAIAHGEYLLVEFPDFLIPRTSGEILAGMLGCGLRPIIAHPERNPILRRNRGLLEGWVADGCRLQLTAQSLLGRFGKSASAASHLWIERGLAHFLASDAHDLEDRTPVLDEAWSYVADRFGLNTARQLLEENPRAVLEGMAVESVSPRRPRKPWFAFW